jgi:branched-chain amino acid transport system permease protein
LLLLRFILPTTQLDRLNVVLALALFAVATNMVVGFGGLVPFGQAAMYGTGAYTVALLAIHLNVSFWLGLCAAPVAGACMAAVTGALALRARWLYFSFTTLAFTQLVYTITVKLTSFTGGDNGIVATMVPERMTRAQGAFELVAPVVLVAILVIWGITRTPFGTTQRAIRENRDRAEALGINVYRHQLVSYTLAGGFSGLAGALALVNGGIAYPDMLSWVTSTSPVVVAVLGGMFTFLGPVAGAFVYQYAEDLLVEHTSHWQLVLGLTLLVIVLFRPGGLLQSRRGRRSGFRFRFRSRAAMGTAASGDVVGDVHP